MPPKLERKRSKQKKEKKERQEVGNNAGVRNSMVCYQQVKQTSDCQQNLPLFFFFFFSSSFFKKLNLTLGIQFRINPDNFFLPSHRFLYFCKF